MNLFIIGLYAALFSLIGFRIPQLGDGGNKKIVQLSLVAIVAALAALAFQTLIVPLTAATLAGFVVGAFVSTWRNGALKKDHRIITDSR